MFKQMFQLLKQLLKWLLFYLMLIIWFYISIKINVKLLQSNTVEKLRRHYEIQSIFTENQSQTNFIIEHCRVVFEIKFHKYHDEKQFLMKHKYTVFLFCIFNFLNLQINEITFMFQRIFDHVSFASQFVDNSVKIKVTKKFKNIKIQNEIIVNTIKLNKLFFVFLFINYYIQHCVYEFSYKLTLIFISNDVVFYQWIKILQHFSNMKILITHKKRISNIKHNVTFIIVLIMRDVFAIWLINFKNFDMFLILMIFKQYSLLFCQFMKSLFFER